ncbi:M48 family metallopeptidase [Cochlodiniinecator piscidefendens]|uniref:M48 family metallopeptidase n=1 Tax=Cochlodiniinecator piscidefendens TaxID=2715756 RepID=UPI002F40BDA0
MMCDVYNRAMFKGKRDHIVLAGEPEIRVAIKRSSRSRRLSLRVSHLDGRVTLTAPNGIAQRALDSFALEKADWIRGHVAKRSVTEQVAFDGHVHIEGISCLISKGSGRSVVRDENTLYVPGSSEVTAAKVQGYLKTLARDRLVAASDFYASQVGRPYGKITLRDTRSRWGSCSHEGHLMYSWRLVMAPADVLNYVAAHEVAHLVEMNHSSAFWAVVEKLMPDYATHRLWLRQNGSSLHRYRFSD